MNALTALWLQIYIEKQRLLLFKRWEDEREKKKEPTTFYKIKPNKRKKNNKKERHHKRNRDRIPKKRIPTKKKVIHQTRAITKMKSARPDEFFVSMMSMRVKRETQMKQQENKNNAQHSTHREKHTTMRTGTKISEQKVCADQPKTESTARTR